MVCFLNQDVQSNKSIQSVGNMCVIMCVHVQKIFVETLFVPHIDVDTIRYDKLCV